MGIITLRQINQRIDDTIERYLWLTLLRGAIVDALVIALFMFLLDHTIHPLDTLGHIWLIGAGIFTFMLFAAVIIWARNEPEDETQEEEIR